MAAISTYLNFNGNCEEAFNFYKSVFGVDFIYLGRYDEMPQEDYSISETDKNKIMHVSIPIGNTILMGCDMSSEWAKSYIKGNNFSVSIKPENKSEADKLFNSLAVGGQINMPLSDTFWGAYFGMLTDRFGINWMINLESVAE